CASLEIPNERATCSGCRHPSPIRRNGHLLQIPQSEFAERFCYNVCPRTNCESQSQARPQRYYQKSNSFHPVRTMPRVSTPAMGRKRHPCELPPPAEDLRCSV